MDIIMNNVKELRLKKGYTVLALAQKVGTSNSYISQLENGHRNIMNINTSTMNRLCKALDCSPSDLIHYDMIFKYIDNHFLCDEVYFFGNRTHYSFIFEISGAYYSFPEKINKKKELHKQLVRHFSLGNSRNVKLASKDGELRRLAYTQYGLILRTPYKTKIGRTISQEELEEFGITNTAFSFKEAAGKDYGSPSVVLYDVIQVNVSEEILEEIINRGIQVNEVYKGCVNIRIR